MPLFLLIFGGLLITSAIKGTEHDLGTQVAKDFTGPKSFVTWFGALAIVGALGYVPALAKPSNYMLALILICILLTEHGFFANLSSTLINGATPVASKPYPVGSSGSGSGGGDSSGGGSGGGFDVSSLASVAAIALL